MEAFYLHFSLIMKFTFQIRRSEERAFTKDEGTEFLREFE
ncbi:hypothetical protein J2Z23_002835 [Lederbergia galactosidilyticus]|nr:hypothetical protein [Lederbergia galactosidilytica]